MIFQRILPLLTVSLLVVFTACSSNSGSSGSSADLQTNLDSVSYSLGYQIGDGMSQQNMADLDLDNLLAGMQDALDQETEPGIADMDRMALIQSYQMAKQQEAMQQQMQIATANREAGEEFLAENASNEGVMETESGLQYQVVTEGSGATPGEEDTVTVHYRGTLLDGTPFDSSYGGQPVSFPLNGVIPGWTEGLQLMSEGSTYKLWIPPDLAYGDNPRPGGVIQPGQTLVFDVELIEVQ